MQWGMSACGVCMQYEYRIRTLHVVAAMEVKSNKGISGHSKSKTNKEKADKTSTTSVRALTSSSPSTSPSLSAPSSLSSSCAFAASCSQCFLVASAVITSSLSSMVISIAISITGNAMCLLDALESVGCSHRVEG